MADTGRKILAAAGGYFTGRPAKGVAPSLCDAKRYEFQELEKATKKFKNLIIPGVSGDLGSVHKGVLHGRKDIAVVTLKREGKLVKQHEELVKAVSKLSHRNLLKLDGYCIDEQGTFLCYEYQRYQTLEQCLFRPVHQQEQGTIKKLSWRQRLDILTGICDGLIYLMEFKSKEVKMDIDLKVDRILLYDEDNKSTGLTPKLSLCLGWGQPEDVPGYYYIIDSIRHPKSFSSPEVDITKFGILLLMMIVKDQIKKSSTEQLIDHVKRHRSKNDLDALRDPSLSSDSQAEINECIELALSCVEKYVIYKPTVKYIASFLSNLGRRGNYAAYSNYNKPTMGGYNEQKLYNNLQYKIGHDESSDGLGHIKVEHNIREYRYDELGELNGKTLAVKKLRKDKFSEQFWNEVSILSGLRHRNLMKLEGYCFHTQGTMLCYEYLPDGTLHDRLQADKYPKLTWNERYNIILGICKGLQYLHDECPDGVRIVHMDLKADNVLFQTDANGALIPKIGDFGISWSLNMDKADDYTDNPLGNIMCTPPEYQHGGKITTGVDIYSFGLIMLEIIAGQPRTYTRKSSHYGRRIINQAQIQMEKQALNNFIDQSMGNDHLEQIKECIKIALDCVASDEKTRPDIAHVSLRLAQIGQKQTTRKLRRTTASRRDETSMDKRVPVMGEHEKNNANRGSQNSEVDALESSFKMMGSDTVATDNTSGTTNEQQQARLAVIIQMDCEATAHILLERMLHDASLEPTNLPMSLLKSITNNFSEDQKIGSGGFAVVYKGLLQTGIVAVKKLSRSFEFDESKFNQEVDTMMRVKHKNIVRFLGYCADTQGKMFKYEGKNVMAEERQRLLCFEFLAKGSLDQYITDASQGLEWKIRYQIIKGICEGLHYLHNQNVLHLDLKPANILLTDFILPKIADFGLSRCFDENKSRTMTSTLFGTPGYAAPEFFSGVITFKLDIYSLGVIILEILTGKKGYTAVENVLESWKGRIKTASQGDAQLEQIGACAEIGIQCIEPDPTKRPDTEHIIVMLAR